MSEVGTLRQSLRWETNVRCADCPEGHNEPEVGARAKKRKGTKNDSIDCVKDESLPSAIDNLKVQCNSWPRQVA